MTAAYLVMYQGSPLDRDAFLDYYLHHHVPIIWSWPSVRRVQVELGADDGPLFMVARFEFDNLDDLRAALASDARAKAREDLPNFIKYFDGTLSHQAVEIIETTRPISDQ